MSRYADYPARVEFAYPAARPRRLMTARPLLALLAVALTLPCFALHLAVWLVAGATLAFGAYPAPLWRYQRWFAIFETRMLAFSSSLVDAFPLAEDASMRIELDDPRPAELNRLQHLKLLLALPHLPILAVALAVGTLLDFATWAIILRRGSHPRWLFEYGAGVARWNLRVLAYATALGTDRYPPFDPRA